MFKKAIPVFASGLKDEMNILLGFYTYVPKNENAILRITGSTQYKVFVNGQFVHHGPARTCHGKYRVDELKIGKYLVEENNAVVIRLLSSNCACYSSLKAEGFLQAEVEINGEICSFTGKNGNFNCVVLDEHVQKTLRYTFQRPFSEAYILTPEKALFNKEPAESCYKIAEVDELSEKILIDRDLYYPEYPFEKGVKIIKKGSVESIGDYKYELSRQHIPSEVFTCFSYDEIDVDLIKEFHSNQYVVNEKCNLSASDFAMKKDSFVIVDMGKELTGFINMTVEAVENSILYIAFDEVINGEVVDIDRLGAANVVKYELKKGKYHIQTEEPYSFRYMQICVVGGDVDVSNPGIIRVGFPGISKKLNSEDEVEQKIYDAAIETFRQNTYDIFMDCPSRERAGWLCDSFFTARSEYIFTGKNEVERAFLMNFIMQDGDFPYLPHGMLPMCFPSDHLNETFIPNWAMFFVIELEDYYKRSGDRELIEMAKQKVLDLCDYFKTFENSDGLLEKLDKWIMIEWSKANSLVRDVSFPSNATYAYMLYSVANLYGIPEYKEKAEKIREYIRKNTLVNGFFCDNAVRNSDGELVLSGECTECCQYYMFFFDVASPETYPELWKILTEDFGPDRMKEGKYPEIAPANAFIGNYLRLDVLYRYGLYDRLLEETRGYFLYMAEKTGTLWELISDNASCNHGFASYVAYWLLNIRNK